MKREAALSRRQMLASVALGGAAVGLAGCDRLSNTPASLSILNSVENLTRRVQRALLAPETRWRPNTAPPISRRPSNRTARPIRTIRTTSRIATSSSPIGGWTSED